MSHLTTLRLKFKCNPCLKAALEKFGLTTQQEGLNLTVNKKQFQGSDRQYSQDMKFKWISETEEYSLTTDLWYIAYKTRLGHNFIRELGQEYARQWAHHQAQQMGMVVQETTGEDGKPRFVFFSPAGGQVEAALGEEGKLQLAVKGIQGEGCLQLTQALEAAAGIVESRQQTAEYYAAQSAYHQNQQMIGGW